MAYINVNFNIKFDVLCKYIYRKLAAFKERLINQRKNDYRLRGFNAVISKADLKCPKRNLINIRIYSAH